MHDGCAACISAALWQGLHWIHHESGMDLAHLIEPWPQKYTVPTEANGFLLGTHHRLISAIALSSNFVLRMKYYFVLGRRSSIVATLFDHRRDCGYRLATLNLKDHVVPRRIQTQIDGSIRRLACEREYLAIYDKGLPL
jgi:hypothetical protein